MSTDTSIVEGGKSRQFAQVKALMIKGNGGKFYPWYPETERKLGSLSVDKNGVYLSSEYGVYGWDRINVNVVQTDRVTGKDPETGEEKTVTVNPDTGELVGTIVPVEIRVTTPPTKTTYIDGETINYEGIVVHAYSAKNEDMGEVPFNELTLPVTTAQGESGPGSASSALDTGSFTQPIPLSSAATFAYNNEYVRHTYTYTPINDSRMIVMSNRETMTNLIFASANPGAIGQIREIYTNSRTGKQSTSFNRFTTSRSAEYDGRTVYYVEVVARRSESDKTDVLIDPFVNEYGDDEHKDEAAWTAIYGTITDDDQSIPILWQQPDSGAILETSFNITVTGGE